MISYLSVDRVESLWVVCEVENVPIECSRVEDLDIECFMCDIDFELFYYKGFVPRQGEVYSVYHENGKVLEILSLEIGEARRRIEFNSKT